MKRFSQQFKSAVYLSLLLSFFHLLSTSKPATPPSGRVHYLDMVTWTSPFHPASLAEAARNKLVQFMSFHYRAPRSEYNFVVDDDGDYFMQSVAFLSETGRRGLGAGGELRWGWK